MRPALFSVIALLAITLAHADSNVTGKYRIRSASNRSGSVSELTLRVNGRFLLERDGKLLHGDYRVDDGRLTLRTEDGDRLRGEVREGRVILNGQGFDRVSGGGADLSRRRFPTDASSGRLRKLDDRSEERTRDFTEPTPRREGFGAPLNRTSDPLVADPAIVLPPAVPPQAPVNQRVVPIGEIVTPALVVAPAAPAVRRFETNEFVGTWTVRRDGLEEKGWRMEFKKNGKFKFTMKGLESEGEWTIVDNDILLVYKSVDGEPLEEGAAGIKRLPVAIDASAFKVDTYRYERASGK